MIGEEVHKWVGEEPSGVAFNAPIFDKLGRPHNPMVNSGAIMVCALIVH
jgi:glutaminase